MATTDTVYGAFIDYFKNIKLTRFKRDNGYDLYGVKLKTSLFASRFIFVIVPINPMNRNEENLNDLDWVSFQTRTSEENFPVPEITIVTGNKDTLSDVIKIIDRTKERSTYSISTLPIRITLMHDPKKNNTLQFPDECKLYQALETYRCSIDLL